MNHIDLAKMSTDDLMAVMPASETAEWEFKDARIFEKENFGEFKSQKLGKIVSSFANSGGGYLVLGKRDKQPQFDAVPLKHGNTPMRDHLSLVISQCVTPHIQSFRLFEVPMSGGTGAIIVVEFADSQAAPHQSNCDVNYFYRLPGHAVSAPHFHIELLRSRVTRSALNIVDVDISPRGPTVEGAMLKVDFLMRVAVENVSLQAATAWGVQIKSANGDHRWTAGRLSQSMTDGCCVRGEPDVLLPGEKGFVKVAIRVEDYHHGRAAGVASRHLLENLDAYLIPISQNFAGEPYRYRVPDLKIAKIFN